MLRSLAAIAFASTVVLSGCSSSDDVSAGPTSAPSAITDAAAPTLTERYECVEMTFTDAAPAPQRSRAASVGYSCDVDGEVAHVWERTDADTARVDASVGGGVTAAECPVSLLITERYFAIANSSSTLTKLTDVLGPELRAITGANPTVSYLAPPCDLNAL